MSEPCALCGAYLSAEQTCQDRHYELLAFEAQHAVPHSTHFLHVTCFMLQHAHYSNEALPWVEHMLRIHLTDGMTEQQLLRELHTASPNSATPQRTWKFQRQADAPPWPRITWPVTSASITQPLQQVERYRQEVKHWAHATLDYITSIQF